MSLEDFFKQGLDKKYEVIDVKVSELKEQMRIITTYEVLCNQQNKDLMAKNEEIERLNILLNGKILHVRKLEAELKEYRERPKIDLRG